MFDFQSNSTDFNWPTVFLNNHDNPRSVSKFGNDIKYRIKSAKLLAMLILTQKGTPVLYQGEEIGMTNHKFDSINQFDDLEVLGNLSNALKSGLTKKDYLSHLNLSSRDHSRTTMQWNDNIQGGFSFENKNWFLVNPNFKTINVENNKKNPNSILNFYKKLISFRKASKDLVYGDYKDLDPKHKKVFIYKRDKLNNSYIIILNMSDSALTYNFNNLTEYSLKISNRESKVNYSSKMIKLLPWDALLFKK